MPTCSLWISCYNKKGVGTYCLISFSGSRIAFGTDKTIAHTNLTISKALKI